MNGPVASEAIAALRTELGARLVTGPALLAGVALVGLLVLLRGLLVLLRRLLIGLLIRLLIWLALISIIARSVLRPFLVLHYEVDQSRRPAYQDQDDHYNPAASEFL